MSNIQQLARTKYGAIAASVAPTAVSPGCCGPEGCGCGDPISANLYQKSDTRELPADAVIAAATASACCGPMCCTY